MWPRALPKRRRWLLCALALSLMTTLVALIALSPNTNPYDYTAYLQHFLRPDTSIGCFRYDVAPATLLPDITDVPVRKGHSIFFHETSCRHHDGRLHLDARQACAVESAARANPNWDVYLTFSAPAAAADDDRIFNALKQYTNVHLVRLHYANYTRGTPLEALYASGRLDASSYAISHASDVLRYLTLYKYGGVYLDLDVVVVKSLEELPANYAGAETQWNVAAGVLALDHRGAGHAYARACIDDLRRHFDAHEWGNNGPMIVTRLLRRLCGVQLSRDMVNRTCDAFHVYAPHTFYPVPWIDWQLYFDPHSVARVFRMIKDSHVLHVWNKHSAANRLSVHAETAYTLFARKFCPRVFEQCDEYF